MPRIPFPIVAFVALLCLPPAAASNLTVHFIDIGQGDATLIVYQNWTVLIDSGDRFTAQRDKMAAYLAGLNVTRVSLAIATHADADHIGQFTNLMLSVPFDQFWVNGLPHTSQLWETLNETIDNVSIPLHAARIHDTYAMGNASLVVLNPWEPLTGDQNKDSVVVKLTYLGVSFMFMGDADSDTEHRLVSLSSIWPHADLLKLGHHGSKYSSSAEWLDAVHPSVVVISAGYQNKYGHPDNETLERLMARNVTIFRTDTHEVFIDDIVATTNGYSLIVRQASTGKSWRIPEITGPNAAHRCLSILWVSVSEIPRVPPIWELLRCAEGRLMTGGKLHEKEGGDLQDSTPANQKVFIPKVCFLLAGMF